jgi:hypothetical protein
MTDSSPSRATRETGVRVRVPVEAGHVMQFRRALGEHDASLDATATPPLTFLMAADHFDPTYPRRPGTGRPWPPASVATGTGSGFHAEQIFEYHRHPCIGEVLVAESTRGRIWDKVGTRGGRLHFEETVTEYRDEHGEPVVTARWITVATEWSLSPASPRSP